jgi:hypothetical protein
VLTCNWHNWKFDLATGEALVGRDPVRTYAIDERDGEIFIDVADPPADERRARALSGIMAAILDNERPRMAREVARLERACFDAREAPVHGFRLCNDRLEDGMTHAHAETPTERLAAQLEPLGHIAWGTQGTGHFPYPEAVAEWNGADFVAAIEAEDETAAIAQVRGALAQNLSYSSIRPAIGEAALALRRFRSLRDLHAEGRSTDRAAGRRGRSTDVACLDAHGGARDPRGTTPGVSWLRACAFRMGWQRQRGYRRKRFS